MQVSNLYGFKKYIATCKYNYTYTYVTTTTEEEVKLTIWFHV